MEYRRLKINIKDLNKLKVEYESAVKNNQESFIFKGREVLTVFAKYLIQYLESEFNKK